MDMKKILQAVDGASSKKPAEGSNDMKKFMQIVEGKGPLNRLTTAESMAMQSAEKKKTITSPVLNVKEDAKPSMIGKYFKSVQEELLEAEQRHKELAGKLAKRVVERVTIGPDGQVTGGFKPTTPDPAAPAKPEVPAAPAGPAPMAGADLPKAEKVDGLRTDNMTVTVNGEALPAFMLGPNDPRPRGGQRIAIPYGMLGIRSIGNATGIIAGGRVYILPASQQEQYTYRDIAEMARLGFSNEEIATKLGFDLTEGLKDPKDNPCWKGYKPVGTKKKGGRTVPNCVPKESVQKKGPAGQLKGTDKVDVKGTVLGSKEKSQKGLRNKLVGGGAA